MSFTRLCPDPARLNTGDLVWIRADHQMVFFSEGNPLTSGWLAEQVAFSSLSAEQVVQLQAFKRSIWVGHLALIDVRQGVPWVIDATTQRSTPASPRQDGVAEQNYADFLADSTHLQSHVWHGRLKGITPAQAMQLVRVASSFLGAPYRFTPWRFADREDFYCSKFIWHVIHEALGIQLMGSPDRIQDAWFTPWDIMQSAQVKMLYEPPDRSYIETHA
jgi:hypothetical protein